MQEKGLRNISTDGLPVLASGVHGTVFRMAEGEIVKLYSPEISPEQVEKECRLSREVFRLGIPTPEALGTVACNGRYGIIFGEVRGDTLGHAIAAEHEKAGAYAERYAALVRKLHETRGEKAVFPELKTELKKALPRLEPFCSDGDLELLADLIGCIPEADLLLHGDLHPGNIMVQDGELLLIDLPEMKRGIPKWDLAAIYRDMIIGPMFPTEALENSIGMKAGLITETGRLFFRNYTGLEGGELQAYMDALLPLYGMNTIFTLGMAEDRSPEVCANLIPMLMTEAVRKHEEELRAMLATNDEGDIQA